MFLISDAMAATGPAGLFGGGLQGLALPLILLVVFYFLLIRPQQKKAKAQKLLLNSIERGDRIVTNSGIIGVIAKPVNDEDTELSLEIASGVVILIRRASVGGVEKKNASKRTSLGGKEKIEKKSKKERREEAKAESAQSNSDESTETDTESTENENTTQPEYESESKTSTQPEYESSTDTKKDGK